MSEPQIEALKAWLDRPDHAFLNVYISPENLQDAVVPESDTLIISVDVLRAALECKPELPIAVQRTVTAALLNVRDAPSINANVILHLLSGQKIMVEQGYAQGVWLRLLGWVSSDFLK